jgi:hypothetical protein
MADEGYDFSGLTPASENGEAMPQPAPASIQDDSSNPQQGGLNFAGLTPIDPAQTAKSMMEDQYGTIPQQLLTAGEGAAQGILGPIAPAIEEATGLTTGKDIRARAETNPFTHGAFEGLGFAGAAALGDELGLPGVVAKIGEGATELVPGVAGVKTAAELATIASSNELSKMVEGDPSQTLGSAAINVGLAGLIGGLGGYALDKVNPLKYFAKRAMKSKTSDFIANLLGEVTAFGAGAAVGNAVGIPIIGGVLGFAAERALAGPLTALAKPFAKRIAGLDAAGAAYDYVYTAQQGQKKLSNAVLSFFEDAGKTVQFKDLAMPSSASRDELEKSLEQAGDMNNAINIGAPIAHYLPDHTTGAAEMTANAINYFKALKPTQPINHPLDTPPPVDKYAQEKYNRALDIAQQPLLVLDYAKKGTITTNDVATLKTIYPGLYNGMVTKLQNGLIEAKAKDTPISYTQRLGLSTLTGMPMDTTLTQNSMQAIINSVPQRPTPQGAQGGRRKPSSQTSKTMEKVDSMYQTPLQAREADRKS